MTTGFTSSKMCNACLLASELLWSSVLPVPGQEILISRQFVMKHARNTVAVFALFFFRSWWFGQTKQTVPEKTGRKRELLNILG